MYTFSKLFYLFEILFLKGFFNIKSGANVLQGILEHPASTEYHSAKEECVIMGNYFIHFFFFSFF